MTVILNELPWNKKLEVWRTIKGFNQEEAAQQFGVGRKVYWNWEQGKHVPIKRFREKISQAIGTSESELFGNCTSK